MSPDTMLDLGTEVLEALDFKVPCGHSQHSLPANSFAHGGEAEYVAMTMHECPPRPGAFGNVYPCCASWARYVQGHAETKWICPHCFECRPGKEMVIILGPLDLM